jgi:hypothetical protein
MVRMRAEFVGPFGITDEICRQSNLVYALSSVQENREAHFNKLHENVHDDPRSGRPSVVNEDLMRAVKEMIQVNKQFIISSFFLHFPQISRSLLHKIVSDKTSFSEIVFMLGAGVAYG